VQGLERRGHHDEGRAVAIRADDRTPGSHAPSAPASAESPRALSRRWLVPDTTAGAVPGQTGGETGSGDAGRAHPATHVLLASGNAWHAGTVDSGTHGPSRTVDDPALYAPESCGARRGHYLVHRSSFIEIYDRRSVRSVLARGKRTTGSFVVGLFFGGAFF
jgi:hypothetical protein